MIVTTALGLALGYFVVRLMLRIRNNVIIGRTYRQALRAELSSLRLDRMLTALSLNRELYLHSKKRAIYISTFSAAATATIAISAMKNYMRKASMQMTSVIATTRSN